MNLKVLKQNYATNKKTLSEVQRYPYILNEHIGPAPASRGRVRGIQALREPMRGGRTS